MEPTDNTLQAGCLGNLNARWTFARRRRALGAAVAGRQRDLAAPRPAIAALDAHGMRPVTFDGLEFVEVASVTKINGRGRVQRRPGHGRSAA